MCNAHRYHRQNLVANINIWSKWSVCPAKATCDRQLTGNQDPTPPGISSLNRPEMFPLMQMGVLLPVSVHAWNCPREKSALIYVLPASCKGRTVTLLGSIHIEDGSWHISDTRKTKLECFCYFWPYSHKYSTNGSEKSVCGQATISHTLKHK